MSILPQLEHCSSKKMNTWLGVQGVGEGWGRCPYRGASREGVCMQWAVALKREGSLEKEAESSCQLSLNLLLFVTALVFSEHGESWFFA